ncbi:MAG: DUF1554 domain-containing protein [Thermomicrobiales bacterium]
MVTGRFSRRAGLGAAATAALAALAAPEEGAAKKRKARAYCLQGQTVTAKTQKRKKQLARQGATSGACPPPPPATCPTGQKACDGACIASSACCSDADCTSPQTCRAGVCATPACGAGGNCTVFISASSTTGNIGGVAAGDAFCQSAASTAGLTGTYKAWLGDSTSVPSTRFTNTSAAGPYVLVGNSALDGANPPPTVAADFAALTNCSGGRKCLQHVIDRTETGATTTAFTWTGVRADGAVERVTCGNWSNNWSSDQGWSGYNGDGGDTWASFAPNVCSFAYRLYCFQQA